MLGNENFETAAINTNLPTAEEYRNLDSAYVKAYFESTLKRLSEPKYQCPKCKDGGMCRDETVICTSIPPKYRYECNKCHHVDYHSI